MDVKWSDRSAKQVKQIAKGDLKSAAMIIDAVEKYSANPLGRHDVKVLKGKLGQLRRLRVGNYRVIFDNDFNVLYIYEVLHRKEAYNG